MCAPILMGGLQLASSLAGAAAQAHDLKRQARAATETARADAAALAARAEYARDDAEQKSGTARARAFASGFDPKSESITASLAAGHARRLDGAAALGAESARTLHQGELQARLIRAQRRQLLARSLLGTAETLAVSGSSFRIPH
jgi:hypothetical protein